MTISEHEVLKEHFEIACRKYVPIARQAERAGGNNWELNLARDKAMAEVDQVLDAFLEVNKRLIREEVTCEALI